MRNDEDDDDKTAVRPASQDGHKHNKHHQNQNHKQQRPPMGTMRNFFDQKTVITLLVCAVAGYAGWQLIKQYWIPTHGYAGRPNIYGGALPYDYFGFGGGDRSYARRQPATDGYGAYGRAGDGDYAAPSMLGRGDGQWRVCNGPPGIPNRRCGRWQSGPAPGDER